MKRIKLTKGHFAIVDDEDFEYLNQWKWLSTGRYARRSVGPHGKQRCVWMHREIMKCPDQLVVDHKNGKTFDNRKFNLRICTESQNSANRKVNTNNKSRLKGVSCFENRWRAYILDKFLGYFNTKEEAAIAYNIAAIKTFGEFARLNKL